MKAGRSHLVGPSIVHRNPNVKAVLRYDGCLLLWSGGPKPAMSSLRDRSLSVWINLDRPQSIRELEKKLFIPKGNIQVILQQLEQRNLIFLRDVK
jgi:hypothetical protein